MHDILAEVTGTAGRLFGGQTVSSGKPTLDLVDLAHPEGKSPCPFNPILPDRRHALRRDAPPSEDCERISMTDWGVSTPSADEVWKGMG